MYDGKLEKQKLIIKIATLWIVTKDIETNRVLCHVVIYVHTLCTFTFKMWLKLLTLLHKGMKYMYIDILFY